MREAGEPREHDVAVGQHVLVGELVRREPRELVRQRRGEASPLRMAGEGGDRVDSTLMVKTTMPDAGSFRSVWRSMRTKASSAKRPASPFQGRGPDLLSGWCSRSSA